MIMLSQSYAAQHLSAEPPLFQPGMLVRHRHYGYRGVVVCFDPCCRADDAWYYGNATQPDRDQPWFHILVDESVCSTYAAQENLLPDENTAPISHPWLARYFGRFVDGMYIRNVEPWCR
ncbi:MAG: heat shock protein HspQ [Phycisphaerales bacterium]|nr:heat shock protein HspQ [Phycisphaerales bacterium]